ENAVVFDRHTWFGLSWWSPFHSVPGMESPEDLSSALPEGSDEGVCSSIEITRLYPLLVREMYSRTVRSCSRGSDNGKTSRSIATAKFKLLSSSSFTWLRFVHGIPVKLCGQLAV